MVCVYFVLVFVDDLLDDSSSFIYGQSPMAGNVPIYAMVTMCGSTNFRNQPENGIFLFHNC